MSTRIPRSLVEELEKNARAVIYHADRGVLRTRPFGELARIVRAVAARYADALPCHRPGLSFAICGEPSLDWLVCAFAALECGVRLVVVPETLPARSCQDVLRALDVKLAVVADAHVSKFSIPGIRVETFAGLIGQTGCRAGIGSGDLATQTSLHPMASFDRASLVAFTSGTTSNAIVKCFDVSLAHVIDFGKTFARTFKLISGDTWAICHSFAHIPHFEYALTCALQGINAYLGSCADLLRDMPTVRPAALVSIPAFYKLLQAYLAGQTSKDSMSAATFALARRLPDGLLQLSMTRALCRLGVRSTAASTGGRFKTLIIGAAPSDIETKRNLLALGLPLFEGYGSSEVGMVSCQSPSRVRIGSVGRLWPGMAARLSLNSTLQVKPAPARSLGYLNEPHSAAFLQDGWFDTGDVVTLEPQGDLYVSGRLKELIINDRGENINVAHIERLIERVPGVARAAVLGDNRPHLVAVIATAGDQEPDEVGEAVLRATANLAPYERVRAVIHSPQAFTQNNGLVTLSGKLRREAVAALFARQIEAAYDVS